MRSRRDAYRYDADDTGGERGVEITAPGARHAREEQCPPSAFSGGPPAAAAPPSFRSPPGRRMPPRPDSRLVSTLLLALAASTPLVLGLVLAACSPSPEADAAAAPTTYLNLGPDAEYVGRETCGTCHPDKLASFEQSQMGRSFRPGRLSESDADFDDPEPIYDPHRDLYYQPFARGDSIYVREYRLQGRDTVHQRVEQIDYIVGSGHHTNSHMRDVGGYVYQIPVTWYVQDATWDLAPGFGTRTREGTRFDRAIDVECMACHNGTPDYVAGSGNRYRELPFGIGCEKCHGPGSVHVEAIRAGRVVDIRTEIDYTIVNPAKLPLDRQYDVCQRCHMQGAAALQEGMDFLDFRPGMTLDDVMHVFWPRFRDSTQTFIMASHPDRLEMSACFEASRRPDAGFEPITCVTCHDPHVDVKTVAEDVFNGACLTCHTPERANECTEAPAVRAQVGDDCSSCHMPTSGTMDIPHVRITDHYIRVPERTPAPPPGAGDELVRLASLVGEAPSPHGMADGFLTFYEQFRAHPRFLDSAAVYLDRALATTTEEALAPSLVRLWFLQGRNDAIVRLAGRLPEGRVEDAWTLYRIGEAYGKTGAQGPMLRYFEAAVAQAPEHLRFKGKLAGAYAAAGQTDRARALYDELVAANPTQADVLNNRGLLRGLQGDLPGAEADFRAALALDPDGEQALANLASLLYNTGRPDEARAVAERLVRLRPDDARYRQFLDLLS